MPKLWAACLGLSMLLQACSRPPAPTWSVPRLEDTTSSRPQLSRDWVLFEGRQLYGWRRSNGQLELIWPDPEPLWVHPLAVMAEHAAFCLGSATVKELNLTVLNLSTRESVVEAAADSGPFEAGGAFYWGQASLVYRWKPGQEPEQVFDLGPGLSLHSVTQASNRLLFGARRESALQVTLNKGLVVSGQLVAVGSDFSEHWRIDVLPQAAPLVDGDRAYFPDQGVLILNLWAIDLATGATLWKRGFGNVPSDPQKAARQGFSIPETPRLSQPQLLNGAVVVRVIDGDGKRLLGLDLADGAERWSWKPGIDVLADPHEGGPAFGPPSPWGQSVLLGVGTKAQRVLKNGDLSWAFDTKSSVHQAPAVDAAGWVVAGAHQIHYFKTDPAP